MKSTVKRYYNIFPENKRLVSIKYIDINGLLLHDFIVHIADLCDLKDSVIEFIKWDVVEYEINREQIIEYYKICYVSKKVSRTIKTFITFHLPTSISTWEKTNGIDS